MAEFKYEGRDLEAMSFAVNYHNWILDKFRPYIKGRVAEVGAGSGSFSELLLKEVLDELVAIEPSQEMHSILVNTVGHDSRATAHNAFFSDLSDKYTDALDCVMYVNVLEHVPEDRKELTHVARALKTGGHVCIFVPALPALYSEHDKSIGHYRRYTKSGLTSLVQDAGLSIVDAHYFDVAGILPWYVLMTLMKKKPGAGSVGLYDSVIVPIMRRLEALVRPPIGKNVLLVARK